MCTGFETNGSMSSQVQALLHPGNRPVSGRPRAPLRRLMGPGLLVAVGYMDPGNWATDIAGGTQHGYMLLSVVILAGMLGILFQLLTVRVAMATGEDLATLTRRVLPMPVVKLAWLAGEAAIIATALAELVGGAIALRLLLGIPLAAGLVITAVGTLLIIALSNGREPVHEKLVNVFVGTVGLTFIVLLFRAQPSGAAMWSDVSGSGRLLHNSESLLVALGILGATLMPHNLYLHSGLVAERRREIAPRDRAAALRLATGDTVVSLMLAMFVNAAILIVAAASIGGQGEAITTLDGAHRAIGFALGGSAALLFAVALYAAGQSSAITGVIAGRMLTRGFSGRESSAWLRGITTRLVAVAIAFVLMTSTGSANPDYLLVLSQVVLGLALPFALIPLVLLASRRQLMGRFALGRVALTVAAAATLFVVALDICLLYVSCAG